MRVIGLLGVFALAAPAMAQDSSETGGSATRTAKEAPAEAPEEGEEAEEGEEGRSGSARRTAAPDEDAEEAEAEEGEDADAGEDAEEDEEAGEEDLTLDEVLQTDSDALQALIEAQGAKLAEQQRAIEELQQDLSETKLDMIPEPGIELEWEGHYRVRGHIFNSLYQSQGLVAGKNEDAPWKKGKDYRDARYMTHRLWLRPVFNYEDLAKLMVEFRIMDDVMWGDNMSYASTALFADLPSNTGLDGQPQPGVKVGRIWTEITIPVGLLRIGRQPTEWGMGILAQSGERHDKKFGTNHYASTNDRVLFATRPIAIGQKIAGKPDSDIPFYAGIAVDRLVEDPLIQHNGFQCSLGAVEGDFGYDPRCDEDGDGISDRDHDYTTDRVPSQRPQDWWVDQEDDVMEMVYLAIYRGEDIDLFGAKGDLTAGTWIVNRIQGETDSNVLIIDGYFNADVRGIILEAEGIRIVGDTRAIALQGSVDPTNPDPLFRRANIWGYAGQVGYHQPGWKLLFEHGYASGDDNVTDDDFTGRPLSPDHNVGLLLYEEVLARVTATNWTGEAAGLWSKGGVYNSRYIFPTAHVYPLEDWELLAGFLTAWPDRPDGSNIKCSDSDPRVKECGLASADQAEDPTLGWEIDVGLKHTWHKHIDLALEAGYAETSDRIPTESTGLNPNGKFFTFQSQIQYRF